METEISSSSHSNETDTIEDILQRLSVNSRQNTSFVENCRDGKLFIQINLFDLMVDSTDTTNKLYSCADVWCHIKFGGDVQKIALKALLAQRGYVLITSVSPNRFYFCHFFLLLFIELTHCICVSCRFGFILHNGCSNI